MSRTLLRSRRLVLEPASPGGVLRPDLELGASLSEQAWALIDLFGAPLDADELLDQQPEGTRPALALLIEQLVELGVLTEPDEDDAVFFGGYGRSSAAQPTISPAARPLFGGRDERADLWVLGLPYDGGASHPGTGAAPAALRVAASRLPMHADPQDGRLLGVLDRASGATLLAGARVTDLGDVTFRHWEGLAESHARVEAAVRQSRAEQPGIPVFLGGDHSLTLPALRGLDLPEVVVLHLDAHADMGVAFAEVPPHHGNFIQHLRRLPEVRGVVQVGLRDLAAPWETCPRGVAQVGCHRLLAEGPEAVLALLPADLPVYLSIDIDVLDPSVAPGTGVPVPDGPPLHRVEELLATVCARREVVGLDLMEFDPSGDPDGRTALAGLRLLLRTCDAVAARRTRTATPMS